MKLTRSSSAGRPASRRTRPSSRFNTGGDRSTTLTGTTVRTQKYWAVVLAVAKGSVIAATTAPEQIITG